MKAPPIAGIRAKSAAHNLIISVADAKLIAIFTEKTINKITIAKGLLLCSTIIV